MANEYKVVAPLIYLRYYDINGARVQGTFYEGALVYAVEDEQNPQPGQIVQSGQGSIDHHLGTEQLVESSDPVAEVIGPAGTPLPGAAPNVPIEDQGPVINEEQASRLGKIRKAAPGIPDEAPGQKQQDGAPPRSAEKPAWVEYARSQGASDEELQGSTKEELIAKYGEKR